MVLRVSRNGESLSQTTSRRRGVSEEGYRRDARQKEYARVGFNLHPKLYRDVESANLSACTRILSDEPVVVIVENTKTRFSVRRGLLSAKSEFFRAAFEGTFREGETQELCFSDIQSPVFRRFLLWCYTNKVVDVS